MIECILLIVISVMFGTCFLDKSLARRAGTRRKFGAVRENFSPYTLSANMETYQPIDYDNNIASIYGYKPQGYDTTPPQTITTCTPNDGMLGSQRWCDCTTLSDSPTTETATRRLIGGVNPRTLIAPRIAPPITDVFEWGTDNYTLHSATNTHISDDLFLSGYATLDNCICRGVCNCARQWNKPLIENFDASLGRNDTVCSSGKQRPQSPLGTSSSNNLKEKFLQPQTSFLSPYDTVEQRYSRLPVQGNYGISQTLEKPLFSTISNGNRLTFVENNNPQKYQEDYITGDEPSMIYDPRMVGYSDNRRSYVDKLLGQPKFYYDDINAARAPNYITRNKIDIFSFGEQTGRLRDPHNPGSCGDNRQLALEEFHNSALLHRTDLQQSLMSKRNGEMWQLRNFPISTNGQRMLGGTSKI